MSLSRVSQGVRCVLLLFMLIGGSLAIGCGSDENEIDIPENPLPIPGPEARLSHQSEGASVESEKSETAP